MSNSNRLHARAPGDHVAPARDITLHSAWEHNGAPLDASQLVRARDARDLDWAAFDIAAD